MFSGSLSARDPLFYRFAVSDLHRRPHDLAQDESCGAGREILSPIRPHA